jgi:hypothetical protein
MLTRNVLTRVALAVNKSHGMSRRALQPTQIAKTERCSATLQRADLFQLLLHFNLVAKHHGMNN